MQVFAVHVVSPTQCSRRLRPKLAGSTTSNVRGGTSPNHIVILIFYSLINVFLIQSQKQHESHSKDNWASYE
jgi:hypothetical protein